MGLVEFSLFRMAFLEGVFMAPSEVVVDAIGGGAVDDDDDDEEALETVCREDLLLLFEEATRLWKRCKKILQSFSEARHFFF